MLQKRATKKISLVRSKGQNKFNSILYKNEIISCNAVGLSVSCLKNYSKVWRMQNILYCLLGVFYGIIKGSAPLCP